MAAAAVRDAPIGQVTKHTRRVESSRVMRFVGCTVTTAPMARRYTTPDTDTYSDGSADRTVVGNLLVGSFPVENFQTFTPNSR